MRSRGPIASSVSSRSTAIQPTSTAATAAPAPRAIPPCRHAARSRDARRAAPGATSGLAARGCVNGSSAARPPYENPAPGALATHCDGQCQRRGDDGEHGDRVGPCLRVQTSIAPAFAPRATPATCRRRARAGRLPRTTINAAATATATARCRSDGRLTRAELRDELQEEEIGALSGVVSHDCVQDVGPGPIRLGQRRGLVRGERPASERDGSHGERAEPDRERRQPPGEARTRVCGLAEGVEGGSLAHGAEGTERVRLRDLYARRDSSVSLIAQEPLCIECGGTSGAGRGDGLPVDVILHVTRREHAGNVRLGRLVPASRGSRNPPRGRAGRGRAPCWDRGRWRRRSRRSRGRSSRP